ncbi:SDR family oxidoreductase [Marinoscillum sp.]|uniref:SDR family oxidoreductase n=1 Tax=Marinoscillum sp. TaxID=2024838 RepID=UPI003BA875B5
MEHLKGKRAIVTGVSKGIGLEMARQLLDAGVEVAGWSRSQPELMHDHFHFIETDVADFNSVASAYRESVSRMGEEIHILINNAGYGVMGPVDELSVEDWKGMFDVNVHGLMYCTKMVVPQMKKMDQGHIVNISSIAGLNGVKNMSGYVATKHAVRGFGHSLMMELRDWGIKVTNVYPGSVKTAFFDEIESMQANDNMMRPEDVAKSVVDLLNTHPNYLPVDLELRPLRPKGKQ